MVKVLVVDDEEMIRWSIAQTLSAAGYEVAEAETARDGLKLFRQLLPGVVFLDLRLPDGDGMELLKQMMQEPGANSAVILMTAHGEHSTRTQAKQLGAFDYLRKPFDFDQIAQTVARASRD